MGADACSTESTAAGGCLRRREKQEAVGEVPAALLKHRKGPMFRAREQKTKCNQLDTSFR